MSAMERLYKNETVLKNGERVLKEGLDKLTYEPIKNKKGKIVKYFKINKNFGLNIKLINERSPLGTAGALYYLKNINEDNLILINGDIITDLKLEKILSFHGVFVEIKQGLDIINVSTITCPKFSSYVGKNIK